MSNLSSQSFAVKPVGSRRTPTPSMLAQLAQRFGAQLVTSSDVREQHGRDNSPFTHVLPPDVVVFAQTTDDVTDLMRLAAEWEIPVIAYGAGSSVEGHLLALEGGISLDVSRMKRVLAIAPHDLTATVQPGVTRSILNQALEGTGLFFPLEAGPDASVGGMCATRASGTSAVRYGTMRENVLALQVVTATGEVLHTGTRAKKSSAGYDLTHLMVGSEGTLGVFTEIVLRLHPVPEAESAAASAFPSIETAVQASIHMMQRGIPVAKLELIAASSVKMVNAYSGTKLTEAPMLLMEFHGTARSVEEQARAAEAIAREHGALEFEATQDPVERNRLWKARQTVYFAAIQSKPNSRAVSTDACVPLSRLAQCLLESMIDADASGLPYFLVGHVGDGNFHFGYLIDPALPEERETAESLNRKLVDRAIRLGGTCTGEHGIGIHKMGFLVQEAGTSAVDVMRAIKRALDPKSILNPGKIVYGVAADTDVPSGRRSWA